jgi:hypothetical protein
MLVHGNRKNYFGKYGWRKREMLCDVVKYGREGEG